MHFGLEGLGGKTGRGGFDQGLVPQKLGIGGQGLGILGGPAKEVVRMASPPMPHEKTFTITAPWLNIRPR